MRRPRRSPRPAGRPVVVPDDRLTEIDAGPFEGMTEEQLRSGPMADDYARWHPNADGAGGRVPGRARRRVGTTLVVSHGSPTRLIASSYG